MVSGGGRSGRDPFEFAFSGVSEHREDGLNLTSREL